MTMTYKTAITIFYPGANVAYVDAAENRLVYGNVLEVLEDEEPARVKIRYGLGVHDIASPKAERVARLDWK